MKIITVTLNPAIDKYAEAEEIIYEEPIRVTNTSYNAGGKGVNVSRVLKRFGIDAPAVHFSGGILGEMFSSLLEAEKIENVAVEISDNIRINNTIYIKDQEKTLKFNEAGPVIDEAETEQLIQELSILARKKSAFIFSGNLPPHTDKSVYATLINSIRDDTDYIFLDTGAEVLKNVLGKCRPDFIKPNQAEADSFLGKKINSAEGYVEALDRFQEYCAFPIISAGKKGIYFKDDDGSYHHVVPPEIKSQSSVGAGDSFVAGFMMTLLEGKSMLDSVKFGTACGAATALAPGASLCYPKDALDIFDQIEIEKIK